MSSTSAANKKQLEDKHQKILRKLLQLPENKKCFDCSEKGPFYACTTLGTFVCTSCSGIHREFQHHVKSISMAVFKPDEVLALQNMGNARAREIWLATWTPDDFPEPDPSDKARVREFMKLKYERKKWCAGPGSTASPKNSNGAATTRNEKKSRHHKKNIDDTPKVEPIETILGQDIPPISITHNVHIQNIQKPVKKEEHVRTAQPSATTSHSLLDPWGPPPALVPSQFPNTSSSSGGSSGATTTKQVSSGTVLESVFSQPEPSKPVSTIWPPPPTAGPIGGPRAVMGPGLMGNGAFPTMVAGPSFLQQVSPQEFQQMSPQQQQQQYFMSQQWLQQQQFLQQQMLMQQRMAQMTIGGTTMAPVMGQGVSAAMTHPMGTNPFLAGGIGTMGSTSGLYNLGTAVGTSSGTLQPNGNQIDPFADLSPLPAKTTSQSNGPSGSAAASRGPGIGMGTMAASPSTFLLSSGVPTNTAAPNPFASGTTYNMQPRTTAPPGGAAFNPFTNGSLI